MPMTTHWCCATGMDSDMDTYTSRSPTSEHLVGIPQEAVPADAGVECLP